jgi:uncharacterized membrane protein YdjX (TVP38/TMEM64 family)
MVRTRSLLLLVLLAAAFAGGYALRREIGIELSVESAEDSVRAIRSWVFELGWAGPAAYVGIVTFRQVLLLPSWALLVAGGLLFGTLLGALLGGLGIVISAVICFGLGRGIGRAWVQERLGERLRGIERGLDRAGALAVGLVTAHPLGPLTPVHLAAGVSTMSVVVYIGAVAVGGPARAFAWSLLGSSLLDMAPAGLAASGAALVLVAILPLAHPGVRRWLWRSRPGSVRRSRAGG